MELLQFLLSFLLGDNNKKKIEPLLQLFSDNGFDISKVIKSLNPEILAPLIKEFISSTNNKNPQTNFSFGEDFKLSPISRIADKEVVYTLNKYFG